MVPALGFGLWGRDLNDLWLHTNQNSFQIFLQCRFERTGTFVSFPLPSFILFLFFKSLPIDISIFFPYDRSQFCDPILTSFSFLLFFTLYFFLRPCYGPGTVLVMGIQGKKTMEVQGEIGKSAIIVGDFNTPLSSSQQRSETSGAHSLVGHQRHGAHYQMGDECTSKDIFLVLCGEDARRVWEGFLSSAGNSARTQSSYCQMLKMVKNWRMMDG